MEDLEEQDKIMRSDLITLKEVYFLSVLVSSRSVSQLSFYEDPSVSSGVERYMLSDANKEAAVFHIPGILTQLSVTASSAVEHRKQDSKLDEYTVRLRIEDEEKLKEIEEGLCALIELLKNTEKACENISVSSALVASGSMFSLEKVKVKVSNYAKNVFYFNRKVAVRSKMRMEESETPDFMLNFPPQGPDYPSLMHPPGWHLNPLIPVTDMEALPINPENVELPNPSTVYFEFRQGCHNFKGKDGPVKQIVLIPTVIAVKVHPQTHRDRAVQTAKRRRVSC